MPKKVTVQFLPDYTYSQLLTTDRHAFVADEPQEAGGEDLGPSAYELLLWALGACTSMTLLMYARRKGWDVEDVSVHLSHDRVHAEDCANAEDDGSLIDCIQRDISVRGMLSEEQKERLLEIAQRCPVHKTLAARPQVVDSIVVGE